ncbi:OLC1v1038229C1 [Oldenlandia corymbosa var. corymbosa]|uniref:OLC1v1038229C1 n=1 Tax=Oldenlandia corymbosa var. corymbosa TaxID=529605 RepID=A0AAV1D0J5_OLDCO|nr:OLC1v1038229C1 [Oldenlandia corymbosa var. corymbosa]
MEYKHFSHPHNLNIFKVQQGQQFPCHGCQSLCQTDSNIYACWSCSFFLHEHCGNATRYLHHPSHSLHPLILIPSPTYCSGAFVCNACGNTGSSFGYCCALCEIDLHVNCALLPTKITHKSHQHDLKINFREADGQKGSPEFCKICSKAMGSKKNWSYCCVENGCDFRVHPGCGTTQVNLGWYQGMDPEDDKAPRTSETQTAPSPAPAKSDPVAELLDLQLQMQMAQQFAQLMSSFNPASLV